MDRKKGRLFDFLGETGRRIYSVYLVLVSTTRGIIILLSEITDIPVNGQIRETTPKEKITHSNSNYLCLTDETGVYLIPFRSLKWATGS